MSAFYFTPNNKADVLAGASKSSAALPVTAALSATLATWRTLTGPLNAMGIRIPASAGKDLTTHVGLQHIKYVVEPAIDLSSLPHPNTLPSSTYKVEAIDASRFALLGERLLASLSNPTNASKHPDEIRCALQELTANPDIHPVQRGQTCVVLNNYAKAREVLLNFLLTQLISIIPRREAPKMPDSTDLLTRVKHTFDFICEHGNPFVVYDGRLQAEAFFRNISDNYARISEGATSSEVDFARTKAITQIAQVVAACNIGDMQIISRYYFDLGIALVGSLLEDLCAKIVEEPTTSLASLEGPELSRMALAIYNDRGVISAPSADFLFEFHERHEILVIPKTPLLALQSKDCY